MSNRKPTARPSKPATRPNPDEKTGLHPRNPHRGRYDFSQLILATPELAAFVAKTTYGNESIDFANPAAVRALNRALLKQVYRVASWDIPPQYLCPPIPGRADYIHHVADLLGSCNNGHIPHGSAIRALDVGVGANCVYPLIGHNSYGWHFVGTDIDPNALANAQRILNANPEFARAIELRLQPSRQCIFNGMLAVGEVFDVSLCNPPFHASLAEAAAGTQRKWHNLNKGKSKGKAPLLNFGGQDSELSCPGGEEGFICRIVEESALNPLRVYWFTTLVSKASSLPAVYRTLKAVSAKHVRTIQMEQGQKKSRFVAWTFLDHAQQIAWSQSRWASA